MPPTEPQSDNHPQQTKPTRVRVADIPRKLADDFVSVYINNTNATPSFYELTLVFGQIVTRAKEETHVLDRAAIAMTWEHALRFRDLLNRLVEDYQNHPKHSIRLFDDNETEATTE